MGDSPLLAQGDQDIRISALSCQMQISCLSSRWGESITIVLPLVSITLEGRWFLWNIFKNPEINILFCEVMAYYEIF